MSPAGVFAERWNPRSMGLDSRSAWVSVDTGPLATQDIVRFGQFLSAPPKFVCVLSVREFENLIKTGVYVFIFFEK